MAKEIKFTYDGVEYTLGFTRRTVQMLEDQGFDSSKIGSMPATMIPLLFEGAFKAHHRWTKPETIQKIFESIGNKEVLMEKLAEMYYEPINAMMDEESDAEKKVEWTASW